MNDCPNAVVRDLLPDLIHERLDPSTRDMVESHIGACADCQAELALLRDLRVTLRRTPAVDVAAIAGSLPAYRAPVRRSWVGWRTAAAITVLIAGGSSIAVLRRNVAPRTKIVSTVIERAPVTQPTAQPSAVAVVPRAAPAIVTPPPAGKPSSPNASAPASVAPQVAAVPKAERELAMGGGSLTDLNEKELASLLKDIEKLDAVPSTDVESGAISPAVPPRSTP